MLKFVSTPQEYPDVRDAAERKQDYNEIYATFADAYLTARRANPVLGLKDGLLNLRLKQRGHRLFGGCTGFGCGAAFNFVALLPDGEVHACRKFPSRLGNVVEDGFEAVYASRAARQYRRGPAACRGCGLRRVCGGCMAVVHGQGGRVHHDRDPQCFVNSELSKPPRSGRWAEQVQFPQR